MRIYGDETNTVFTNYRKITSHGKKTHTIDSGDVKVKCYYGTGAKVHSKKEFSRIYLHKINSLGSFITGKFREHFLGWRWKVAYIQKNEENRPMPILLCTQVENGTLSKRVLKALGKPLCIVDLIVSDKYSQIFGHEYLHIPCEGKRGHLLVYDSSIPLLRSCIKRSNVDYEISRIYRSRSYFTSIKYAILKSIFKKWWMEVTLMSQWSETKVLIRRTDENHLTEAGFIKQNKG